MAFLDETGLSHLKSKNDAAYASKSHTHNYLPLSGGTLTGSLTGTSSYFTETARSRHEYRNVIEYDSCSTYDEIVIKTSIPFANSNSMIPVHIKGYAYGSAAPVDLTIAFYVFDNVFNSYSCISSGAWRPTIYLSTYTKDSAKYVAISLNKNEYFLRFSVDILDIWTSSYRDAYARGWSIQDQLKGTNSSIIPQTDIVTVPYKNLATDISGNAGAAATSTVAAKLARDGNTYVPMTFNWSGQGGQPSWLWGGNDGSNMYVYNPLNFNVNYATSAGKLSYQGNVAATTDWNTLGAGCWTVGQSAAFSSTYNQPVGAYPYGTLEVVSNGSNITQRYTAHNNGQMWFRNRFSSSNDFTSWARTYTTFSKPSASDIGAAPSSHTHSYLPLSGGTLTGSVTFANNTYNAVGDDVAIGDANVAGTLCVKGLNGTPGIKLYKSDGSVYGDVISTGNYTSYVPTKTGSGASGTWGINVTGSSATATTASGANVLNVNTRMDYGWGGVNYFNFNGTAGAAAKVNDSPTSAYWHILRFNHANSSGYYTDLAIPFNHSSLYYKYVQAGSVVHNRWIKVLDDLNYNNYAPTKTGGGASGTWSINVTGSSASCTGNAATATTAAKLGNCGNTSSPMTFYWDGRSGQPTWLWGGNDGNNMYVYNPSNFSVNSAAKLTTARTINLGMYSDGSALFDGSGDITIPDYGYGTSKYVTTDSTATPYWRIAYTSTTSSWNDMDMLIAVSSNYNGGGFGILKVSFRTDNISSGANGSASVRWLARYGYALDQFIVKYYLAQGATCYADLYFKANSSYQDVNVRVLTSGGRGSRSRAWTFDNGASRANPDIRTYTGTSTSVDAGFVLQSSSAVKLATARTIQTNLASTSAASFNGESNVSPGVTGTLPIANGGTSATTKAGARSNLGITSGTAAPAASGTAGDIYIQYA